MSKKFLYSFTLARIALGWLFLWAFFDKLWGLGFATKPEQSWLAGVSPTAGFLGHAVTGPFAGIYHALAGNLIIDWLFMIGLAGIGLALVLGIATRLAGICGALLVTLMFFSLIPPKQNPLIDEHVIYFFLLLAIAFSNSGDYLGFGAWWRTTSLVHKLPFLK